MWLNEELANGRFSSPAEFVAKAVAKGYRWVAYQWNDGDLGALQRAYASATRTACAGKLVFTVWLTRPFDAAYARQVALESQCEGIILEGEIPPHRPESVDWSACVDALAGLAIPKAIVTNFAPFVDARNLPRPDIAAPLVEARWTCITENFISETPNATPERTDFYATWNLGFPFTQPMIEGWRIPDYGDLSRFPNVSHWDAGNVL